MKFFLMPQHQIGTEGAFRIDLAVTAGEDDAGAFVFPACPADESPDVPFSAISQGTGIDNYEAGVRDGASGKTGLFESVGHHIRIPLVGLAAGSMYIVFHDAH